MLETRNVRVHGDRTSMRLEPEMWDALDEICRRERASLHMVASRIAEERLIHERAEGGASTLTSYTRLFILRYFRSACTETGHRKAGHGLLRK